MKRKRAEGSVAVVSEAVERIRCMEKEVVSSPKHLNNLVDMIHVCTNGTPEEVLAASHALYRTFLHLLADTLGHTPTDAPQTATETAHKWTVDKYTSFVDILVAHLHHLETAVQTSSLFLLLELVRETSHRASPPKFNTELHSRIVRGLLTEAVSSPELLTSFNDKFVAKFDDARYHTLKMIRRVLKEKETIVQNGSVSLEQLSANVHGLLLKIRMVTTENELTAFLEEQGTHPKLMQLKTHKKAFGDCWVAFLKLPLTPVQFKQILLQLDEHIIPHMPNALLLADFLTDSYNAGGLTSILALNGLFTLMTEYNLEYPEFYNRLYTLLDPTVFAVKYRPRFFRLVNLFLNSSHLSIYLVAAFIKRFARLALLAPPHGALLCMTFAYNLLRRHPQCGVLIHRAPPRRSRVMKGRKATDDVPREEEQKEKEKEEEDQDDPYQMEEPDPAKSHALASSLWEVMTLQDHYCPSVAKFARMFGEPMRKEDIPLEEVLDVSYKTLFEGEITRKVKRVPLAFEIPSTLQWDEGLPL